MTFEGQYLTYAEYQTLGGSAIGDMPFNLLEFEARRQIDIRTFNRLKDLDSEDIPQEVKLCEYKMIDSLEDFAKATSQFSTGGNVASEKTDGYSVSYITADKISEIVKSKNDELEDVIRSYLLTVVVNGEHIMYVGVD